MLKKFTVRNYKNFKKPLTVDFSKVGGYRFNTDCVSDNIITKLLIYGRNATGKTNLGVAITDIQGIMFDTRQSDNDIFLNADSDETTAEFTYEFEFGKDIVLYSYCLDEKRVLYTEKLSVNGHKVFDIDFLTAVYDVDLKKVCAETIVIDMYRRAIEETREQQIAEKQLPFLRWLVNNAAFRSDSPLIKLYSYINGMRMQSIRLTAQNRPEKSYDRFYEMLANNQNLKAFEDFLNAMGIECKLVMKTLPDGRNELYFKYHTLVPFVKNASSGTIALMNLYRFFIMPAAEASLFYMDEFDAFYHYEMADHVIKYIKENYPRCQLIMTTHNTNLMNNRLMRPDCLMILSQYGTLTALCDATERELREGHNLEKMYKSGEFEKYE
ncbi:MAG: AAA family ATPase [Lachnospiraceae bacterium]|nr:AAA family ATPase [Lachnospiraceae bacterium]